MRGGSWLNNQRNARVANRNRNTPGNVNDNLGFRCASSPQIWGSSPVAMPPALRTGGPALGATPAYPGLLIRMG